MRKQIGTSVYHLRRNIPTSGFLTPQYRYAHRKKKSVMKPANPAIKNADSRAAKPSNGTAVTFRLMKGVPFPAGESMFGDSGLVGCTNAADVCSGMVGAPELKDDGADKADAPSGRNRPLDCNTEPVLEVCVPPVVLGDAVGLLALPIARLPAGRVT